MAHSFLEFRGNHMLLRDEEIFWLMSWMKEEVHVETSPTSAQSLFEWWVNDDLKSVPGCIDIPFDEYLVGPHDISFVLVLLGAVEGRLDACGEVVPAQALNGSVNAWRFVFQDQKAKDLKDVVAKVRNLLARGLEVS